MTRLIARLGIAGRVAVAENGGLTFGGQAELEVFPWTKQNARLRIPTETRRAQIHQHFIALQTRSILKVILCAWSVFWL